jgi:hypothetical protein
MSYNLTAEQDMITLDRCVAADVMIRETTI